MQSYSVESTEKGKQERRSATVDFQSNEASTSFEAGAFHSNNRLLLSSQRQQNLLNMQRLHGNAYVQRFLAKEKRTGQEFVMSASPVLSSVIQRYQAGEEGHGGLEQRALTSVGFSSQEASQIYFGNWLRDFSQLNSSGSPLSQNDFLSLFTVVRILGLGEYNREIQPKDLGTYVPSEHLDNPSAGGTQPGVPIDKITIEDPEIQALAARYPEGDSRRSLFDVAFAKLSPEQQAAYRSEEASRELITEASRRSGLPQYIERGKMHAKDMLKRAIGEGRTPAGFEYMGNALHAVEDYFSHSNFVDVAIWALHNEGVTAAKPFVNRMVKNMHGVNPALAGGFDPSGQPRIITGSYSPGANDWVSRLELLKAQLHSGEFAKPFIIGLIRLGTVSAEQVASALGGRAGSAVGSGIGYQAGAATGGVGGLLEGASAGASQGFEEGANAGYRNGYAYGGGGGVGEAIGETEGVVEGIAGGISGFFSGAYHGMMSGASRGSAAGSARGASIGQSAGSIAAGGLTNVVGTLVLTDTQLRMLVSAPFIKIAMAPSLVIIDQIIEHIVDQQKTQSGEQAASRNLTGLTHSQIAKDSSDHPLYGVSVRLAEEADRQIGAAMQAAWTARVTKDSNSATATNSIAPTSGEGKTPVPNATVTDAEALSATSLVDKFVSQPAADSWWRPILTAALSEGNK